MVKKDDEVFLVNENNKAEVDKYYIKLWKDYKNLLEIHKTYMYRNCVENTEQIDKFVLMEDRYADAVSEKVYEYTKLYKKYNKSIVENQLKKYLMTIKFLVKL